MRKARKNGEVPIRSRNPKEFLNWIEDEMATEADAKVVEKALDMARKELSMEEYARFLAFIGPKAGDTAREIRRFRRAPNPASKDTVLI